MIKWYRKKIEQKLEDCCQEVLGLVDRLVAQVAGRDDSAHVFFLKMRADYNRYMCEFVAGER